MKYLLLGTILVLVGYASNAQTCEDVMDFVKSESNGTTYYSYTSDAITKATFYDVTIDFEKYYFVIVKFNNSYTFKEYIYQVVSQTKFNYSINYISSAGKAFWDYIEPYNDVLGCAPEFEK